MGRREFLAVLLFLTATARRGAFAAAPSEYEVKAVFLFNFSQFVSWPPAAFDKSDAPMIIAVLGTDPFGRELDSVVKGEHVGGHPIEVRRYQDVSEIKDCHILFIDRSETSSLGAIVDALRGRSILTVSDIDDAARAGVMIDLVKLNDRIRMRINLAAARASGLTISSQLLRPAEIVGPTDG
jgi:hypothetical protein